MSAERSPELKAIVDRIREAWRPARNKVDRNMRDVGDELLAAFVAGLDYVEKCAHSTDGDVFAASDAAARAQVSAEEAESHKDQARGHRNAAEECVAACESACEEAQEETRKCRVIRDECEELKDSCEEAEPVPTPAATLGRSRHLGPDVTPWRKNAAPWCEECGIYARATVHEDRRLERVFECPQCESLFAEEAPTIEDELADVEIAAEQVSS